MRPSEQQGCLAAGCPPPAQKATILRQTTTSIEVDRGSHHVPSCRDDSLEKSKFIRTPQLQFIEMKTKVRSRG